MIEKHEVYIEFLQMKRMVHIYLPNDYKHSKKRYSVFYMFDGHNLFYDEDATYGKSWGLRSYLDAIHMDIIVVGIECNHQGNHRIEEFSPYSFKNNKIGAIHGQGASFFEWIINDLKPCIDQQYPTHPDRLHTAIGGSSMGGIMALYGILHHNDVFSKAACLSPYLQKNMSPLQKELKKELASKTHIYLSWGSNEASTKLQFATISSQYMKIIRELSNRKICFYPNLIVKGEHNEASWEKEVPIFLSFLFNQ